MPPQVPSHWMPYFAVADADTSAKRIGELGGSVMLEPRDIEPGTYCWSELVTTDVEGSKTFYGAVFGWGSESYGPQGPGGYTEWKLGGHSIGGMMARPENMPPQVPSHWVVYFAVADADASAKRIGELGGSVMSEPRDIEPGRFALATDPAGALFSVIALKEGLGT